MCIRDSQYTIQMLKTMKKEQEQKIEYILDGMDYPESEIIIFESPIKNTIDVNAVSYTHLMHLVQSQSDHPRI